FSDLVADEAAAASSRRRRQRRVRATRGGGGGRGSPSRRCLLQRGTACCTPGRSVRCRPGRVEQGTIHRRVLCLRRRRGVPTRVASEPHRNTSTGSGQDQTEAGYHAMESPEGAGGSLCGRGTQRGLARLVQGPALSADSAK